MATLERLDPLTFIPKTLQIVEPFVSVLCYIFLTIVYGDVIWHREFLPLFDANAQEGDSSPPVIGPEMLKNIFLYGLVMTSIATLIQIGSGITQLASMGSQNAKVVEFKKEFERITRPVMVASSFQLIVLFTLGNAWGCLLYTSPSPRD